MIGEVKSQATTQQYSTSQRTIPTTSTNASMGGSYSNQDYYVAPYSTQYPTQAHQGHATSSCTQRSFSNIMGDINQFVRDANPINLSPEKALYNL